MKTLRFGKSIHRSEYDVTINYNHITPRITLGNHQNRPQFCFELLGDRCVSKIYAVSAAMFERLRNTLAAGKQDIRLIIGKHLLRAQTQYYPTGWPDEGSDRIRFMSAPSPILEQAEAGLPKPALQFPLRKEQGIEVIHIDGVCLVRRLAYHPKDLLTVHDNHLTLTSGNLRQEILSIHVVTANQSLAKRLAASLQRKTARRLMINDQIIGIAMMLADKSRIIIGNPNFRPQTTR
jgi:hypothetical protein